MSKGSLMSNIMASGPVPTVDYVPYVGDGKKKKKKKSKRIRERQEESIVSREMRSSLDPLNYKALPQKDFSIY